MNAHGITKHDPGASLSAVVKLPDHLSARQTFHIWQVGLTCFLLGSWFLWFLYDRGTASVFLLSVYAACVMTICAYRVLLVMLSIATDESEISISSNELATLQEKMLPLYSILVPLYREAKVLPHLIDALLALDYPTQKLDIILLLEADDRETILATKQNPLPSHFRPLIVPTGYPKTKPRACNVGLAHARGKFLVIYDAEDRPDTDQLKKALIAFQRSDEQVICVQSRLNYYNPRQNLLTRLFTLEYSFWFDLLLPGLCALRAPIPLGGTSNHFRTSVLRAIGGWDAFNVAEDCDLGIRLAAAGHRTIMMNSTTWEEANSQLGNWIRQRSRWVKGYLQTYLVHMRDPVRLFRNLGFWDFLHFQLTVGGTPAVLLLTPILWLLFPIYTVTQLGFTGPILSSNSLAQIITLSLISLIFGNFFLLYLGICGAVVRNNHYLVKYVLLTPVYFALQSVAAWKGFFQLLTRPHYWEKTIHGLFPSALTTSIITRKLNRI